jgi:hypothetical protein
MDSGLKLKLALDAGENPYIVADRFLEQHDLPGEFKEQVGGPGRVGCGDPVQCCLTDVPGPLLLGVLLFTGGGVDLCS